MAADAPDPKRDEVVRELMRHRSALLAFILSVVRDFAFAEEAMQEVAVAVCEQAGDFRPGTGESARSLRGTGRARHFGAARMQ